MKYYIRQLGEKDCGYTCVKMLWSIIYKRKDFLYYPVPSITNSSSLRDLMIFAKKEGVSLSAYRCIDKMNFFIAKRRNILIPIKQNDVLHMVLIRKTFINKIEIYDPESGIYYINKKKLFEIWNGEYLEVVNVIGSDYKITKKRIIPFYFTFLTLFFNFLSFCSLITALYFIDGSDSFYITLGLFLGYILFEFIYRKMLIQSMKYFDKHTMVEEFSLHRNDFKNRYVNMTQFKVLAISNPIQLFSLILMCILGIVVLGINSPFNLISIAIIFIFQLLFKYYEARRLGFIHKKINNIENNFEYISHQPNDIFIKQIDQLNNETYHCVSYFNFKKYLMVFLIIAMSLLYCNLVGNFAINFLLFHFFFYLYINEDLEKIINFDKNYEDFKYYKALYLYYFDKY